MKLIVLQLSLVQLALILTTVNGGILNYFQDCFYTVDECPNSNITFWLYTKETEQNPLQLDVLNLRREDFLPSKPLEILIHGYTGNRDFDPNPQIRPALLHNRDVNVISVDYAPLAQPPCYLYAAKNLHTVARCLGQLINTLIESGIFTVDDIHIIGFSLGGQTAGITANYVNYKLKHITGLDPAKPLFQFVDNSGRLDSSDAEFVDVIHTDALGRGVLFPTGHVDFYPNDGFNQPGCKLQNEISSGSCNHARAPFYYGESIATNIGFYGNNYCPSWLNINEKCVLSTKMELMGYDVSREASGVYFLTTNMDPPYARGPMARSSDSIVFPDGFVADEDFLFDY